MKESKNFTDLSENSKEEKHREYCGMLIDFLENKEKGLIEVTINIYQEIHKNNPKISKKDIIKYFNENLPNVNLFKAIKNDFNEEEKEIFFDELINHIERDLNKKLNPSSEDEIMKNLFETMVSNNPKYPLEAKKRIIEDMHRNSNDPISIFGFFKDMIKNKTKKKFTNTNENGNQDNDRYFFDSRKFDGEYDIKKFECIEGDKMMKKFVKEFLEEVKNSLPQGYKIYSNLFNNNFDFYIEPTYNNHGDFEEGILKEFFDKVYFLINKKYNKLSEKYDINSDLRFKGKLFSLNISTNHIKFLPGVKHLSYRTEPEATIMELQNKRIADSLLALLKK